MNYKIQLLVDRLFFPLLGCCHCVEQQKLAGSRRNHQSPECRFIFQRVVFQVFIPKGHYSEDFILKGHYSKDFIWKGHYSKDISKDYYNRDFYLERFLFRRVIIPKILF